MTILGDLTTYSLDFLIALIAGHRASIANETNEIVRTSHQLALDEIVAELARRNAAVIADIAAKGGAS